MTSIAREISKGQLVKLLFLQDAVADSQSAVAMAIAEVAAGAAIGATEYNIPWDFDIVGISIASDSARTAGTLTVDATINGTAQTVQAVLDATNTQYHYKRQPRETKRGVAGQRVGAKLTTASWTPVTADVVVVVWIIAYLEGI